MPCIVAEVSSCPSLDAHCSLFHVLSAPTAYNESLLKSKRWLLNARPKTNQLWDHLLMVSDSAQCLFMQRVVASFQVRGKKMKSKAKARWTAEEWDRNMDYACLVEKLCDHARRTTSADDTAVQALRDAFIAGCSHCKHACPS